MNTEFEELRNECKCVVCHEFPNESMISKECGHRACKDCVDIIFVHRQKQCPMCRAFHGHRRLYMRDPSFDFLLKIAKTVYVQHNQNLEDGEEGVSPDLPSKEQILHQQYRFGLLKLMPESDNGKYADEFHIPLENSAKVFGNYILMLTFNTYYI